MIRNVAILFLILKLFVYKKEAMFEISKLICLNIFKTNSIYMNDYSRYCCCNFFRTMMHNEPIFMHDAMLFRVYTLMECQSATRPKHFYKDNS